VTVFLGVDGCRDGWIAAAIDDQGARRYQIIHRIEEIAEFAAARVMIDIPIGLPETGRRDCDLTARKLLGTARSRVFLDVRRPLLAFHDYVEANRWAKKDQHGISKQLWFILRKIDEVDKFITPERQETILESHPELVFQRFNRGLVLPSKKSRDGQACRRDLAAAAGFTEIDHWLGEIDRKRAGADDLLDACALALAARDPHGRIPDAPATDARGLRMEIWY
jgi:predicted RNase H-like nuclease